MREEKWEGKREGGGREKGRKGEGEEGRRGGREKGRKGEGEEGRTDGLPKSHDPQ